MKIVQINAVYKASSTGRTTFELHTALEKMGHESFVFCSDHDEPQNNIFQIGNSKDHKCHATLSRVFGKQVYFSKGATRRVLAKLSEIQPDIVILRNLHANYIHLPLLLDFLVRNDVATLLVLHDFWFMTGHCCYYTNIGCDKWRTECHHCPLLHTYNKSLFFDRSRKIFRDKKRLFQAIPRLGVIGVSRWVLQEAKQSFLQKAKLLDFIYNWIDLIIFHPLPTTSLREKLNLSSSDFVILGVAQGWSQAKGLNQFMEIARNMPDAKVVLVGRFPSDVSVPHNLLAVGEVNTPQKLAEYYSMADVFVNPSIQETFGKVTAEALACGTPVVGSNTTATPELIPASCGFTFSPHDVEDLLKKVALVREKGKQAYSEQCQRFAAENFGKEGQIAKYIDIINRLLRNEFK